MSTCLSRQRGTTTNRVVNQPVFTCLARAVLPVGLPKAGMTSCEVLTLPGEKEQRSSLLPPLQRPHSPATERCRSLPGSAWDLCLHTFYG